MFLMTIFYANQLSDPDRSYYFGSGVANQLVSIWIRIGATDKNLSWHYPKNISSLYLFEISHVLRWQSYCRGHLTSKKILKSNFTVCHSMFTVTYSTLFTLKQDRSVIRVPCSDVLLSLNIVWGWGGAGLRSSGQSRLAKTNWPCPKTSQDDDVWPRQAQPVINHARLRHHPHGNIFLVIFFRLFFSFFYHVFDLNVFFSGSLFMCTVCS